MYNKNHSNYSTLARTKAEVLKALAHPTRVSILEYLKGGERCVCEIIEHLNIEQSNVSQHLAILKRLGILSFRREGLKMIYRVKHREVFAILRLLEDMVSAQARETAAMLESLGEKKEAGQQ